MAAIAERYGSGAHLLNCAPSAFPLRMKSDRAPLDATALGIMVLCTALWGFQQVAIKLAAHDVSLVMQAGIRSVVATALLFGGHGCARHRALPARWHAAARDRRRLAVRRRVRLYLRRPRPHQRLAHDRVHLSGAGRRSARIASVRARRAAGARPVARGAAFVRRGRARVRQRIRRGARRHAAGGSVRRDRRGAVGGHHRAGAGIEALRRHRNEDALLSAGGVRADTASRVGVHGRTRRSSGAHPARVREPRLSGRDRRLRELPRLVLAADALLGRAAVGVFLPLRRCSACWRACWRSDGSRSPRHSAQRPS